MVPRPTASALPGNLSHMSVFESQTNESGALGIGPSDPDFYQDSQETDASSSLRNTALWYNYLSLVLTPEMGDLQIPG